MPIKKPTTKAGKKRVMQDEMHRFKKGELHSGSSDGPKVKNRKQAVAIAMNEAGESKARRKRLEGKSV